MKSIGSSSKMLSEAIGERITGKTSSAKHKLLKEYKNTKNVMGSWTSETKLSTTQKLKNVRSKIDGFSLKRNKAKRSLSVDDEERPQTISLGNESMFQSLHFNSPLNNRSYNLENIPKTSSNYEIPRSLNRLSSGELPSYEDVVKSDPDFLQRNTSTTQSLYSMIHKQNNFDKGKNISDSHLNTITSSESSEDEHQSNPPNFPVPELPEQIYGRIKKLPSSDYENAPMIPLRKPPPPPTMNIAKADTSDSSTICGSNRSSKDFTLSPIKSLNSSIIDRSESWQYVDNVSHDTIESVDSTEPIYTNDENERVGDFEQRYAQIFDKKSDVLMPEKAINVDRNERKSQSVARDILNEFDPLSRESFDAFIMTKMNHLSLLETLLSEETYGTIEEDYTVPDAEQLGENSSVESVGVPTPPERNDSLVDVPQEKEKAVLRPAPKKPHRIKKSSENRVASVIIHQNLKLKGSVENLVEPFLAQTEDGPSTSTDVDLTRPKPPQTNWFVPNESEKFLKNNLDNPNNFPHAPTDKLTKTVPQLTKVNNLTANREQYLPTYEESKNDEIVNAGMAEKGAEKPRSSLFSFGLKRRGSLKEKLDPKDFVPRPPFSEEPTHSDKSVILFKLPSGVIEDILKELNPRFVEVKRRQFKAFSDSEFKVLKEHLDLSHLTSIQYLVNHKFAEFKTESGRQIYCFEINLAVPKTSSGVTAALLDNKGSPVKTQRVTYVYGIHSKNEK